MYLSWMNIINKFNESNIEKLFLDLIKDIENYNE